jgi:hypothetical protein
LWVTATDSCGPSSAISWLHSCVIDVFLL